MKKAVIYVRRSREDKNSIQNQIKFLSVFVSKLNLNMYKVYCDEGYSGEDFERPSFLLMKEDIQKGLIDVVIVKDLSRIGRSLYKVGNFIENILHKYHIRFISVVDKIDTINKMSYDEIMFKNLFNELYLKDYKKKINNSLEILGNKKKITRCMKYGYKNINGERCIDEYACLIIRRIFELANNGFNSKKISDILNKENIIPRAKYMKEVLGVKSNHLYHISDKWNSQMIRNILIDKEYCGYIITLLYQFCNSQFALCGDYFHRKYLSADLCGGLCLSLGLGYCLQGKGVLFLAPCGDILLELQLRRSIGLLLSLPLGIDMCVFRVKIAAVGRGGIAHK